MQQSRPEIKQGLAYRNRLRGGAIHPAEVPTAILRARKQKGAEKTAQRLRALVALPEDLSLGPNSRVKQLTTRWNSSFGASTASRPVKTE